MPELREHKTKPSDVLTDQEPRPNERHADSDQQPQDRHHVGERRCTGGNDSSHGAKEQNESG